MSRIAELRASLSSPASRTGMLIAMTRMEWAEFIREFKYERNWTYPSVRECQQYERTQAYWADRWEGPLNS
jgi:hypothetical protein